MKRIVLIIVFVLFVLSFGAVFANQDYELDGIGEEMTKEKNLLVKTLETLYERNVAQYDRVGWYYLPMNLGSQLWVHLINIETMEADQAYFVACINDKNQKQFCFPQMALLDDGNWYAAQAAYDGLSFSIAAQGKQEKTLTMNELEEFNGNSEEALPHTTLLYLQEQITSNSGDWSGHIEELDGQPVFLLTDTQVFGQSEQAININGEPISRNLTSRYFDLETGGMILIKERTTLKNGEVEEGAYPYNMNTITYYYEQLPPFVAQMAESIKLALAGH